MVDHVGTPASGLAPAVEHRNLLKAVRCRSLRILIEFPELVTHRGHVVDEVRKLKCELQVSAVADTVDGTSEDRPSCGYPVYLGFPDRVPALVEGVREEVGKEPSFRIFHTLYVTYEPECGAVSDRAHDCVDSCLLKAFKEGLRADPVVTEEHHCFLAALMTDIRELLYQGTDFPVLECHEVPVFL